MKYLLTIIFLATATIAQAGTDCVLLGQVISAVESMQNRGLTRDQAFDTMVSGTKGSLSRIKRAEMVEAWLVWVYDNNGTSKQWVVICKAVG